MNRRLSFLLALVVVAYTLGCASTPPGIHMSRLADVKAGKSAIKVDTFGEGEVPAVVVTGCGGHNVVIRIVNLADKKLVKTYREYVPESWVRWWWFNDLSNGSYRADLSIEGEDIASVQFVINRQTQ